MLNRSLVAAILLLVVLVGALLLRQPKRERLVPLPRAEETAAADQVRELPAGVITVSGDAIASVTFPFVVESTDTGLDRVALLEGEKSANQTGHVEYRFSVGEENRYRLWVRARWDDSCGNSVAVKIDDFPISTVGQDAVFAAWHWVPGSTHVLSAGDHVLSLREREDGIAIDQMLLSPDPEYVPSGAVAADGEHRAARRFADDFSRSPGHGLDGWRCVSGKWDIAFSLDPNRVPNQYSLVGVSPTAGDKAVALVDRGRWSGVEFAASVRLEGDGRFGMMLDRDPDTGNSLNIGFESGPDGSRVRIAGGGVRQTVDLGHDLRSEQWHRITVSRWAWFLEVALDGRPICVRDDLAPATGMFGLFTDGCSVAFDDVSAEEVVWQGEGPGAEGIAWHPQAESQWFKPAAEDTSATAIGRSGSISLASDQDLVRRIAVECLGGGYSLSGPGIARTGTLGGFDLYRFWPGEEGSGTDAGTTVAISVGPAAGSRAQAAEPPEVRLGRIAFRSETTPALPFRLGPYRFSQATIPDPSDYLDFTPEEQRRIATSSEADKLRRQAKHLALVGHDADSSVFVRERGYWTVRDGVLNGRGREARLRFSRRIQVDFAVGLRVRLRSARDKVAVRVTGPRKARADVPLSWEGWDALGEEHGSSRDNGDWHDLRVEIAGDHVSATCEGVTIHRESFDRGLADTVSLVVVDGEARFDDLRFDIERQGVGQRFYAFDRRETDWWREQGTWIDHGGISCVLTSNWVSLVSPDGLGMLWNKRAVSADCLVGTTVEENTEWYGWSVHPSHTHYSSNNILLTLGDDKQQPVYALEVNADRRRGAVLYRQGKEVASVPYGRGFPIYYRGGHAPYSPRRNRLVLVKEGSVLSGFANGVEVLRFEDPAPLPVSRVAIGGRRTRANFTHISIRDL